MVGTHACRSRTAHVQHGAERHRRFLTVQHGFGEVDRGEVGETGDHHFRQFLRGPGHIQGRTDAHTGRVQQKQPLPYLCGPAGKGGQFRRVPQGGDRPGRPAVFFGGPQIDGQQPVVGHAHLVGGDPAGGEQFREEGRQADVCHQMPLGVRRQAQQPPGLVVGQQQPSVAVDDEHTFTYGVQHRGVMLVQSRHLGGAEAARLPPQTSADQRRSAGGEGKCGHRGAHEHRQVAVGHFVHVRDRDAHGHQAGGRAVGPWYGHHRVHGRPPAPPEGLGEAVPEKRLLVRAENVLADQCGIGVGIADSACAGHDDVLDAGDFPDFFRERLQHGGGIPAVQRRHDARGVSERIGYGVRTVSGFVNGGAPALHHERDRRRGDEQNHERQLQKQHLPGHGAHAEQGAGAPRARWPEPCHISAKAAHSLFLPAMSIQKIE